MTTAAVGDRYRIVTEQGGRDYVSSVVIGADEVEEQLDTEQLMHEAAGWQVHRFRYVGDPHWTLYCIKGVNARSISARSFTPHNDTPEGGDAR